MLNWLNLMVSRVRAIFNVKDEDREFGQELEAHLDLLIDDKVRRGMDPDQARREARVELGGITQLQEAHRETRGLPLIDTVLQDLRYTLRTLRRDLGFTTFAVLTVGLGIGASSTIFSVVNAVLLRPLPFQDSKWLVWISNTGDDGIEEWRLQVNHFLDARKQNRSFSDMAAYYSFYGIGDKKLSGAGEPIRLTRVAVTENFFPFLGVQPILGRQFTTEESQENGPRVALLSYQLWTRQFGSDTAIVGRRITLDDQPVTVAGVLPESFDFGTVFAPGTRVDLYTPFPLTERTNRQGNTLAVVGRLKPGVSVESARSEFAILGKHLTEENRNRNTFRPKLLLLSDRVNGRFRPALLVLAWAVAVVMLIVCANLSNLQLARMASRQKEMAVRVALGAARRRLVQQTFTESLVLACTGAVLGLALAYAGTRILSRIEVFNIPLLETVRIDLTAFGFTVLTALLTGTLFGLMPALQVPTLAVHDNLKDSSRGSSTGRRHAWVRVALVVSEVAFASVLLVGAGLLIRSFLRVLDVNLGFQPERAAALRIDPGSQYTDQAKRNAYFDEALRRVRALPGITSAGLADILPLGGNRGRGVAGEGQVYARDQYPQAYVRVVSDSYFAAMGVPIRSGRDFTQRDVPSSEPVVIMNETLARMLWPGQNAVGKILASGGGVPRRVVGIVGDVLHKALEEGVTGEMYLPIRQTNDYGAVDLVVRTDLRPASFAASVRAALQPIAPDLPKSEWRPLQQLVDRSVSPRRFLVMLLAGFSGFALMLASLGIYGVVSYSVSQRKQEIGIRMALGASAGEVRSGILLQTLRLAATGVAIGTAASWALGRVLSGLLFGVTSTDPLTFGLMALILITVATIAGYLPARRASRIDPIVALRAD